MPISALRQPITPPDEHLVTVEEALEPLFYRLEAEVDAQLLKAAADAGWETREILSALDRLRRHADEPIRDQAPV